MGVLDQEMDDLVSGDLIKQTYIRASENSQYWNLWAGALDENVEGLQREFGKADIEDLQQSSPPAMTSLVKIEEKRGSLLRKYRRDGRRMMSLVFCASIGAIMLLAGLAFGISAKNAKLANTTSGSAGAILPTVIIASLASSSSSNNNAEEPTASDGLSQGDILSLFVSATSPGVYEEGGPEYKAAQWMLFEDERIKSSFSNVEWIQRFLLVFFYYSKTNNGNNPWLSCGQQSTTSSECTYQRPVGMDGGGGWIYSPVPSVAWLSAENECEWAGISCITVPLEDGSGSYWESVSEIQLGTFAWETNYVYNHLSCCCCWAQRCSFRFLSQSHKTYLKALLARSCSCQI
jgi:hypothetical protein